MPTPHAGDRLSAEDAIFLYLEKNEMPLHIGCVAIFDGGIALEPFTAFVESKLPLIPRYRQRIVAPPFHLGHPTWEFDPQFDIRRHIRQVSLKRGTEVELQALAGGIFSEVMDRSRPLWDVTLASGLKPGRTAIIFRLHHCLADGVAGIGLLNLVLDASPLVARLPRKQPFHAPPLPDAAQSLADALVSSTSLLIDSVLAAQSAALDLAQALVGNQAPAALQQWLGLVPDLAISMDRLPFNAPCRGPRRHAWMDVSIREIKAIRNVCGGTLNDVVLTLVTAAVSRYADLHGQPVANRLLRYWVPVNLRPPGEHSGVGNRISILPVTAPLDVRKPEELLQAVHQRTQALKRSHILDLISLGAAWLSATPVPLQVLIGQLGNVLPVPPFHLVCTNVPGPPVPLYLLGRKMLKSYPYVPIGNDMGFCCATQSYDGRLYFGLTADAAAVPDVHRIREFLEDAFAELRQAAGVPVTRRRRTKPDRTAAQPQVRVRPTPPPPDFYGAPAIEFAPSSGIDFDTRPELAEDAAELVLVE